METYLSELPTLGTYVNTPRFCKVRISAIVRKDFAEELGFTEPTHFDGQHYEIKGKSIGTNRMIFAVVA